MCFIYTFTATGLTVSQWLMLSNEGNLDAMQGGFEAVMGQVMHRCGECFIQGGGFLLRFRVQVTM